MLRRAKDFKKFKLRASDGDIGRAREFCFDDGKWTVRFLVADTGGWLSGRQVLISPYGLGPANEAEQVLPVGLTKKEIEISPSLECDQPVSRQYEARYYGHYGWPEYWDGPNARGPTPYPARRRGAGPETNRKPVRRKEDGDPHLRSTQAVTGYHIQALDGEIGHVEDFIIDDETWAIRYLVVDTKNWCPGKRVLISPKWIERVSWKESKVFVGLERAVIQQSPEYRAESLNRDYETALHGHYGRPGYWADTLTGARAETEKTDAMQKGEKMNRQKNKPPQESNGERGKGNPDSRSIERRAYELYLKRGKVHGHDFDDWLQAECELKQRHGPLIGG